MNYADVLESYMIEPAMEEMINEIIDIEIPKSVKLKFFNKEYNVTVKLRSNNRPVNGREAINILNKFVNSSERISKQIEKRFCDICNKYNDDPSYTGIPKGSIKSYSDIKGLDVKRIYITASSDYNYKLTLFVTGDYIIDEEHGYSLAFPNNRWDGGIGQESDAF